MPDETIAGHASGNPPVDVVVDSAARGRLRRGRLRALAVPVPHERRLDVEATVEPAAPLFPSFLVLELLFRERGRLTHAVGVTELYRQLGRACADPVPGRTEGELIGDGADAARVDVDRDRDTREDRPRPVGRLPVERYREDMEVVAAA